MTSDPAGTNEPFILGYTWYPLSDQRRATRRRFLREPPRLHAGAAATSGVRHVSLGDFKLLLSGPGASGSRPMPDSRGQDPGGWNRIVLRVTDVERAIEALKKSGVRFRNQMESGPSGRQIQLEDPDGNPIELFEPAR